MENINIKELKKEETINKIMEDVKNFADEKKIYLRVWEIEKDIKDKLINRFNNMFFNLDLYSNYDLKKVKDDDNLFLFADRIFKDLGLNLESENFNKQFINKLKTLYFDKNSYSASCNVDGKIKRKSFSIRKYDNAFELAVEYRKNMEEKYYNCVK